MSLMNIPSITEILAGWLAGSQRPLIQLIVLPSEFQLLVVYDEILKFFHPSCPESLRLEHCLRWPYAEL